MAGARCSCVYPAPGPAQAEGLFDLDRKRPLPFLPRPDRGGDLDLRAAVHDIARWSPPLRRHRVLLVPAQARAGRPGDLCQALEWANLAPALGDHHRRGGGSWRTSGASTTSGSTSDRRDRPGR